MISQLRFVCCLVTVSYKLRVTIEHFFLCFFTVNHKLHVTLESWNLKFFVNDEEHFSSALKIHIKFIFLWTVINYMLINQKSGESMLQGVDEDFSVIIFWLSQTRVYMGSILLQVSIVRVEIL